MRVVWVCSCLRITHDTVVLISSCPWQREKKALQGPFLTWKKWLQLSGEGNLFSTGSAAKSIKHHQRFWNKSSHKGLLKKTKQPLTKLAETFPAPLLLQWKQSEGRHEVHVSYVFPLQNCKYRESLYLTEFRKCLHFRHVNNLKQTKSNTTEAQFYCFFFLPIHFPTNILSHHLRLPCLLLKTCQHFRLSRNPWKTSDFLETVSSAQLESQKSSNYLGNVKYFKSQIKPSSKS